MLRALEPEKKGFVDRDGVRIYWERFGEGERTVTLLPTWNIIHSRCWKMQVPYLARHARVVTFDPRGNGKSDRPVSGYSLDDHYRDALAVLGAAGVERTAVFGLSDGCFPATMLAALRPDLVELLVLVGFGPGSREPSREFWQARDRYEGWEKNNAVYWRRALRELSLVVLRAGLQRAHSTKRIEDSRRWGLETTPRDPRRPGARVRPLGDHPASAGDLLPDARRQRIRGRDHPARGRDGGARRDRGREARRHRGRGALPARARPGEVQPARARLPRRRRAAERAADNALARTALARARSTSRARSASATRSGTSRSRASFGGSGRI